MNCPGCALSFVHLCAILSQKGKWAVNAPNILIIIINKITIIKNCRDRFHRPGPLAAFGYFSLWPFVGQTLRNRGLSGLFFFFLCAHMPRASQATLAYIPFHCGFHTGLAPMENAAQGFCFPWDFSDTCHIGPE